MGVEAASVTTAQGRPPMILLTLLTDAAPLLAALPRIEREIRLCVWDRLDGLCKKTRNPKHEIRKKSEKGKSKKPETFAVSTFVVFSFSFLSDFGFRISGFLTKRAETMML